MNAELLTKSTEVKITFLLNSFNAFDQTKKGRTFMSIGRKALDAEWFNTAKIHDIKGQYHRQFIERKFLNNYRSSSDNYITNLFPEERVANFVTSIYDQLVWYKFKEPVVFSKMQKANGSALTRDEIFITIAGVDKMQEVSTTTAEPADFAQFKQYVDTRLTTELKKLRPNIIRIGERPEIQIEERLHHAFRETLGAVVLERQAFLAGQAGTGKTTLAEQTARAIGLRFGFISCTAGISEAHLLGRMDAHGNYLLSQFVDLYENGGVFLFDEIDAADSNTMLIINSALANGLLSVPNRPTKPVAKRHEDFYCICAANTWGFGSNEYAGRNILDAAFLDRFVGSRIEIGYDTELESHIASEFPELTNAIWIMRENVKQNRIRRVISTRAIVSGVRAMKNGKSLKMYLDRLTTGWTVEEKSKALNGI